MNSPKSQLRAGILLSYISQMLQVLVTLFYTPVMLRLLGQSEYGLYQLVYSVVSYLSLFTFGFSSAYVKFYAQAQTQKNPEDALRKVNGMFLTVFGSLGILVLIFGGVLVLKTDMVLGRNLTYDELATCRVLMAVLVANCVLHFPTIVFQNFIIANERFIWLQIFSLLGTILNPCLTFPLLLLGYKSISLAVVLLLISALKLSFSAFYCMSKLNMRFKLCGMKFGLLRDISKFSFFIFIESIVSTINISLDRFLLGRMMGSVSVAVYAVGGQINTLFTSLSTSISSVFTPRINKMVAEGKQKKELSDLFINVGKIQFMVLYLVLLGFSVFGARFMELWAGKGYGASFYAAIILIWPNTINLIQNVGIEIQRAMGLQKYRSMMYLAIAVMNIVISCVFIGWWGETGAALGTAVAWIIGSGILMNWFYEKRVGLDIKKFWMEILFMSKFGVLLLVPGLCFQNFIKSCSIYMYVIVICIFAAAYLFFMYYLGLKKSDRKVIASYIYLKIRKGGK